MDSEKREVLKQCALELAEAFGQMLDLVEDHETRLSRLEEPLDLSGSLGALEHQIQLIPDEAKRKRAYAAFLGLCDALGIYVENEGV